MKPLYRWNSLLLAPADEPGLDAGGGGEAGDLYKEAIEGTEEGGQKTETIVDPLKEPTKEEKAMAKFEEEEAAAGRVHTETGEVKPKEEKVEEKPAPTLLKLDPETIAELRAGLVPSDKKELEKVAELTPAQIRELLNPVELKEDFVTTLLNPDIPPAQKVQAFLAFANAIVKNATSITRLQMERKEREFNDRLNPMFRARDEEIQQRAHNDFYTQNADLKKYEKVVKVAASEITPYKEVGGKRVDKSPSEIYKEVADRTRATLKELGITISPANPGAGGGQSNGEVEKVPLPNKLSTSGRSGGEASGAKGAANNPDADIYKR